MIITKIFSIFLIIVIIILIVNLLKVEPFYAETTSTTIAPNTTSTIIQPKITLNNVDLDDLKKNIVSQLGTLPTQFTDPTKHVALLETKLAEFRTLQTNIDKSLVNSTNLKTKINGIVSYQSSLDSLNNNTDNISPNKNTIGVKSRYKHVPVYFTTTSQIGDNVKIKVNNGVLAIQYEVEEGKLTNINFITKTDTTPTSSSTTSSSTHTCDEFELTEIENEKDYYDIINKYRYKDIINISKLYNVAFPLYLLIPTDEHIGNYSLSINRNNLSLSEIDGKNSEQFELMF